MIVPFHCSNHLLFKTFRHEDIARLFLISVFSLTWCKALGFNSNSCWILLISRFCEKMLFMHLLSYYRENISTGSINSFVRFVDVLFFFFFFSFTVQWKNNSVIIKSKYSFREERKTKYWLSKKLQNLVTLQ